MRAYDYSSAFAADIEAFLAFKRGVGIESGSRNWTLYDFDRWCVDNGAAEFDRACVESYVKQRRARTSPDHLTWMSHIRELGRFMRASGREDAYVLSDEFSAKMVRVAPYLLTQSEVDAFFEAAVEFDNGTPWAWQATCFFGLMHACGLRTCEARRLRVCDVDLGAPSLDIIWSKGNRSRRLAITGEVAGMLKRCDAETSALFGQGRRSFFVNGSGNPADPATVGVVFRRIWRAAGLPESKGGKSPRPYCFRHRFAYANLERWRKEGVDVAEMLPYLARYMGHSTFDSTYYYVHTSPDFMEEYAAVVAESDASVLPEVGFDA